MKVGKYAIAHSRMIYSKIKIIFSAHHYLNFNLITPVDLSMYLIHCCISRLTRNTQSSKNSLPYGRPEISRMYAGRVLYATAFESLVIQDERPAVGQCLTPSDAFGRDARCRTVASEQQSGCHPERLVAGQLFENEALSGRTFRS